MKFRPFLLILCFICAACNNEDNDIFESKSDVTGEYNSRSLDNSDEEKQKILDIIQKYKLKPVASSEYIPNEIDELIPIASAEELDMFLGKVNIVVNDPAIAIAKELANRVKTRSESSGQRVVPISGTNNNGSATVYVDLDGPSVIDSTVRLELLDAILAYRHISGNAYRSGNIINFTAYGEGWVKLIFEGIELYKYETIIEGYCDSDGTTGTLTKF